MLEKNHLPSAPRMDAGQPVALDSLGYPPPARLELTAAASSGSRARAFVCGYLQSFGLDDESMADIEVAVGEAVTNALLYGCGKSSGKSDAVVIALRMEPGRLIIDVRDQGPGFDEETVRQTAPGDAEAIGGRGLLLMRALMDSVEIWCDGAGTTVRLERYLRS